MMSNSIKEAKLDLFVVAYPHDEDHYYNLHLEGRLGDEVVFDIPMDNNYATHIFNQIKSSLEGA